MSGASPPSSSPKKKRKRRPIAYGAMGFAVTLTGLALLTFGPAGPFLVGVLAQERAVWRLGRLHLEGVSGARLGDLTARRLTIRDEEGVWLEAENVTLGWKPARLLVGGVAVDEAAAETVHIYRRPKLTAPGPAGGSIDVELDGVAIRRIVVDEPVAGEAAVFSAEGALVSRDGAIQAARAEVLRLDAPEDALRLRFDRQAETLLEAQLDGAPEGFVASALQVRAPVLVTATAAGDETAGRGRLRAEIGEAEAAVASLAWTAEAWSGEADVRLAAAPVFSGLADRFGATLRAEGKGEKPGQGRGRFEARVAAENLSADVAGMLGQGFQPQGPMRLRADIGDLAALTAVLKGGSARFDGTVLLVDGATRAEGELSATRLVVPGLTASFAGPVKVSVGRERIDIDANASLKRDLRPKTVNDLAGGGTVRLRAEYDRQAARLTIRQAALDSTNAALDAKGVVSDAATSLRGGWTLKRLGALQPRFSGAASGGYTLDRTGASAPFRIIANGRGRRVDTDVPGLAQLLGTSPALSAVVVTRPGGVAVQRLQAVSPQLRFGARGAVVDDTLDLALEASARGPVLIGAAEISGVADATGTVRGPIDAPALAVEATMAEVNLAGLVVEQPAVSFVLDPTSPTERRGRMTVRGRVAGEQAVASADLAATDEAFAFENLDVLAAGLAARGRASFSAAGPSADVEVVGSVDRLLPASGRIAGQLKLSPGASPDSPLRLAATARVLDGGFGDTRIDQLDVAIGGPLDALAATAKIRGRGAEAQFALDGQGRLDLTEGISAEFTATGAVNGSAVATTQPLRVRITDGTTEASGALALGDGSAAFTFSDGARLSARATLQNAPLKPLMAFAGERASGTASGTFSLSGSARTLSGEADLTLDDALLASRMREPLDVRIAGRLADRVLSGRASAVSASGLDAMIDGRAPVDASASPLRIALSGEGTAVWRASGPAAALWGLVGTLDQRVTGTLDGAGSLRFGVGVLAGEGGFTLANGAFSDRVSGVDLREISARVTFAGDGARLEQFSARDRSGGTITGTGRAVGVRSGRIDLETSNIRLLDRPDAQAQASGPLSFVWRADGATLTGDLRVSRADLDVPSTGAEGIAQLDVIEINMPADVQARRAPEQDDEEEDAPDYPVALDVRVRAPGRVFLRGRGLDTEWSVDVRAQGTVQSPTLLGEARLVRGAFDLASRRFDVERGVVRFSGPPSEAQVDILAVRETPELTARIALTGFAADPEIGLSSTPALPEDEILPQVLFGRAVEDLSGLEAAQLAGGLATLAGQSSLDIVGAARSIVGLDRLDVRETDDGLRVAGGKYLTRDVYLEVARNGLGETETALEWRVRPRFYVISAFAPSGDRRLSVRWRREY